MSPGLYGTDAKVDIPLPAERAPLLRPRHVARRRRRRIQHDDRVTRAAPAARAGARRIRIPQIDNFRALFVALNDWVINGTRAAAVALPEGGRRHAGGADEGGDWTFRRFPALPFVDNFENTMLRVRLRPELQLQRHVGRDHRSSRRSSCRSIPTYVPQGGRRRQRDRRASRRCCIGCRSARISDGTSSPAASTRARHLRVHRRLHPVREDQGRAPRQRTIRGRRSRSAIRRSRRTITARRRS